MSGLRTFLHRASACTRIRTCRVFLTAVTAASLLGLAAAPPAFSSPRNGPTAIVSLGDSYISGEAGRWRGNSLTNSGGRDGTDRAWTGSAYDPSLVYGASAGNGCHRSDSAEVKSATGTGVQALIDLSCSAARIDNVVRSISGGRPLKGEAPQADQLAAVARQYEVKAVVLAIGGNDLGFASIIETCAADYIVFYSYCHDDQQELVDGRIDRVMAAVGKSVDEIRSVMAEAGYTPRSYRIILQSYPSPIPRHTENRYPQSGWSRVFQGGCPFWNADADWARDRLVPQIAERLRGVATAKGVQFLDLQDMLQGREVCSTASRHVSASQPPSATRSEWARWIDSNETQGPVQESMHPNYYGQLAQGRCLTLVYAAGPDRHHSCRNTPGADASGMYLTSLP